MKHSLFIAAGLALVTAFAGCKAKEEIKAPQVATETVQKPASKPDVKLAQMGELPALANPNTVSLEDMTALTGMPENIPALIVKARPFADAKAFDAFLSEHANAPTKEAIYSEVFIPMALNTTPEADFMIIPGVGKKMAHEFEEYRPYKDWDQFNREIGKYVDAAEVARYRRYVTLN